MAADDDTRVEAVSAHGSGNNVNSHTAGDEKPVPDDKAAQFVVAHQNYPPMTAEQEKRIKKKIDAWMIPLVSSLSQWKRSLWLKSMLIIQPSNSCSSLRLWQLSTRCSFLQQPCTTSAKTTTCRAPSSVGSEVFSLWA